MKLGDLGELAVLTLRNPDAALRVLRGLDLPMAARWTALFLAVVLSRMLGVLLLMVLPVTSGEPLAALLTDPMTMAGIEFFGMVLTAFLVTVIGRMFGGHGTFADALLAVAWIELLLVALMAVQLVMLVLLPGTVDLLGIVVGALSIYLTVTMTKALHGFTSLGKVALVYFGFSLLLGIVAVTLAPGLVPLPEGAP